MSYFAQQRRRRRDGSPRSQYGERRQRRALRQAQLEIQDGAPPTVEQIAHHEQLLSTFDEMKVRAGKAPGVDEVTFDGIARSEIAAIFRQTAKIITRGQYRPAPARAVSIPKSTGVGHRLLRIRTVLDRVVSSALNQAMTPFWESQFLPMSYAYRSHRTHFDLLADLIATMVDEERYVLAIDDVRGAFDNVSIEDAVDDHRRHIADTELVDFIERVLRGGDDIDRSVGIHQGDPYSPTTLNVRLHFAHDVPLAGLRRLPPAYRFADNLCFLSAGVPEGHQALLSSRQLLARAGLTLKGEDGPPTDLRRGSQAQLLGFTLRLENERPRLGLGDGAWKGLEQALVQTHVQPNPPEAARHAVQGWVNAHGPALEKRQLSSIVTRLFQVAAHYGFRELCAREALVQNCERAHARWEAHLRDAFLRRGMDWRAVRSHGGSAAQRSTRSIA